MRRTDKVSRRTNEYNRCSSPKGGLAVLSTPNIGGELQRTYEGVDPNNKQRGPGVLLESGSLFEGRSSTASKGGELQITWEMFKEFV